MKDTPETPREAGALPRTRSTRARVAALLRPAAADTVVPRREDNVAVRERRAGRELRLSDSDRPATLAQRHVSHANSQDGVRAIPRYDTSGAVL